MKPRLTFVLLSIGALGASVFAATRSQESPLDPTVPKTIVVGDGGALWPTVRGPASRSGRSPVALPRAGKLAWARSLSGRIEHPPLVDEAGTIVVITVGGGVEATMAQLARADGKVITTRLDATPSAPPILLGNGTRVVITPTLALGYGSDGAQRWKTQLEGGASAIVGVTPLPTGGFAVLRGEDLLEYDGVGAIAGRTKLAVSRWLAARDGGEVVGVTQAGEVWSWRSGKLPHSLGKLGPCPFGPIVLRNATDKHERIVCTSDTLVDSLDVTTGKRKALLGKSFFPFRTSPAFDTQGTVAITGAYGVLLGQEATGEAIGPFEVPGAMLLQPGKEVSMALGGGEVAPVVDDLGTRVWGSGDGVAAYWPGAEPRRIARCDGLDLTTTAGFAPAGPKLLVVACRTGRVELYREGG